MLYMHDCIKVSCRLSSSGNKAHKFVFAFSLFVCFFLCMRKTWGISKRNMRDERSGAFKKRSEEEDDTDGGRKSEDGLRKEDECIVVRGDR